MDAWAKEEEVQDDVDADADGWELDADAVEAEDKGADEMEIPAEDEELGAGATPGASETKLWVRNSPFAGDHVTVGSSETAMCKLFYLYNGEVISDGRLSSSSTSN